MSEHRSMIETAVEVLKKKRSPQKMETIYDEVAKTLGFDDSKKENNKARFYSDLSLTGVFVFTGDGHWDLKERQPIELWDKDASFFIDPEEIKKKKTERAKERLLAIKKEEERLEKIRSKKKKDVSEDVELEDVLKEIEETEQSEPKQVDKKVDPKKTTDSEEKEADFDLMDEEDYNEYMDDYEELYEDK